MTTPTQTKAALIDQVAFNLGVLAEGQSIESDAYDRINERVDPVVLGLSVRGIVDIANTNDINTEWFLDLADCVTDACSTVFGQKRDPQKLLFAEDRLAWMARRNDAPNAYLRVDTAIKPTPPFTYSRWVRGG